MDEGQRKERCKLHNGFAGRHAIRMGLRPLLRKFHHNQCPFTNHVSTTAITCSFLETAQEMQNLKESMPDQETLKRLRQDRHEGKSPSTQAGEFIREEIHHIREGVHGARSTKQAIAIGLSKARRAGVRLPPPKKGRTSEEVRRKASKDYQAGESPHPAKSSRSLATLRALRRESRAAASPAALARHSRNSARRRSHQARTVAAEKVRDTRAAIR